MKPIQILVVDDNEDCIHIVEKMLGDPRYAVDSASSGTDALVQIGQSLPDIMLLDVMMPIMTGFEVLEQIRADNATYSLPVILLTACINDEDVMNGYAHGADYYITKPFTQEQLCYGIDFVLGGGAQSKAG